jgi:hypothetical protein
MTYSAKRNDGLLFYFFVSIVLYNDLLVSVVDMIVSVYQKQCQHCKKTKPTNLLSYTDPQAPDRGLIVHRRFLHGQQKTLFQPLYLSVLHTAFEH